jgi:DUF4097 and DUF4098 domain-containing protein YvlB
MPLQVRWSSHPLCVIMRPAFAAAGFAALFTISSVVHAQGVGREESEFKWSRRLEAGATLVIRSGNGPIAVHESSSDRVEITAVKRVRGRSRANDVGFDIVESSNQVEICTLYGRQNSCRERDRGDNSSENVRVTVEFTVNLPRGARLRAATGNGRIDIDRGSADVSASTGNGAISIGETSGRVDASTGNGDVQVDGANGPVSVSTGNGRVFVLTARGAVDASTGNGDIDVRIKSGPIERDMKFSTGSGSIRISLPQDFNGSVDATSGTGSLRTDFDIAVIGRLDAHHVRGTIGRGGPQIRLVTGSGTIELRKGS